MDIAALRAAGARHLIQSELLSDVVPAIDGPIFVRADGAEIFDAGGRVVVQGWTHLPVTQGPGWQVLLQRCLPQGRGRLHSLPQETPSTRQAMFLLSSLPQ